MIKLKIKEFMMAMGKQHPASWLVKHCGFSRGKAQKFASGNQASISLADIAKLCAVLKCTPNEFFYWQQTPSLMLPEGHPCLTQLPPPDGHGDWLTIFNKLSPEEMAELRNNAIDKLKDK